jgi:hypothetical protein
MNAAPWRRIELVSVYNFLSDLLRLNVFFDVAPARQIEEGNEIDARGGAMQCVYIGQFRPSFLNELPPSLQPRSKAAGTLLIIRFQ